MTLQINKSVIVFLTLLFVGANLAFIYNGNYLLNLLPPALIAGLFAIMAPEKLFWFAVFCTPLSLNMEDFDLGGFSFYFPTEPCLFGLMFLFIINQLAHRTIDLKVLTHPVTLAVVFHLVWIFFTTIPSEDPFVSFKFFVVRLWFVIPAYFLVIQIFKNKPHFKTFYWLYLIPLAGVVVYTVAHHATFMFAEEPAHWVMYPFFKDHTSYGAVLAMFFPAAVGLYFSRESNFLSKPLVIAIIIILAAGIIFSYTRAAWVSLIAAFGVFLILRLRIKGSTVLLGVAVSFITLFSFYEQIMVRMELNKTDSSDDLGEHVSSITNVATDASNLERINRWNSAMEMFYERPFFGWGPGTYQFNYAKFQRPEHLTIISTNAGDGGNAHSEYLGPLAEQGLFGMLAMLLIVITVSYSAVTTYHRLPAGDLRMYLVTAYCGLITYYTHGILNNYLDTDKASIPFWGFTAMIVVIDVYYSRGKSAER